MFPVLSTEKNSENRDKVLCFESKVGVQLLLQ